MAGDEQQKEPRSKTERILQTFEVTMAGKIVTVPVKSILSNRAFRKSLGEMVSSLVRNNQDPVLDLLDKMNDDGTMENREALPSLCDLMPTLMCDGFDFMIDMLWQYAPELQKYEPDPDGTIGQGQATDEEIIDAACEVLQLVFPLLKTLWMRALQQMGRNKATATPKP